MKIKGLIVMTGVVALLLGSCGNNAVKNAKIQTKEDSLSYAFGIVNYNALNNDSLTLDPILVAKAMIDGKEEKAVMSDEIARSFIMVFINESEAVKKQKQAELNKVTYKDYIDQNKHISLKIKKNQV